MRKKRIVSLVVITSLVVTSFTACGQKGLKGKSKSELIKMVNQLNDDVVTMQEQYNDLYALYNGIQSEESPSAAIGITGDGTGRYTFNSVDSKIIFPAQFQYPDSTQTSSNGSINIVDYVNCSPGSNWICKMNAATLELEHTSGISGTIKVGEQHFLYEAERLKTDVLSQWFVGLPPSTITYTNIYVGDQALGCQAVTPTTIDSEDAYLRCGMLGYGNYSITYVFVYRGQKDENKDESITNLLNSIAITGTNIIVEQ